ncbi:MAG: TlyA family RNA methyltransferase [Pseudomonadota bacterium]
MQTRLGVRLDQWISDHGFAPSRSRARDLIISGLVRVNGARSIKPARTVAGSDVIDVDGHAASRVSRGATKLETALDAYALSPAGLTIADIGASTGGFTQVLLERGAAHVYAIDVGRDQLHSDLRDDSRVSVMEQTDVRDVTRACLPKLPDALVADLSFISLRTALRAALDWVVPGGWAVALIKPQFEVGRGTVGKGGIVRDTAAVERAVDDVATWLAAQPGWATRAPMSSPLLGGDGNREFLIAADRS